MVHEVCAQTRRVCDQGHEFATGMVQERVVCRDTKRQTETAAEGPDGAERTCSAASDLFFSSDAGHP